MTALGKLNSEGAAAGGAPETPHKKKPPMSISHSAWPAVKKVTCTQECGSSEVGNLSWKKIAYQRVKARMEIPMPDAALAGPAGTASAFVYVTFLPSPFGPGYTAGIRGWEGIYDPVDGWADGTYYRLAGVARVPAPVSRYCCPQWHKTVVDRLRRNGVVFLNDASAEAYMKD